MKVNVNKTKIIIRGQNIEHAEKVAVCNMKTVHNAHSSFVFGSYMNPDVDREREYVITSSGSSNGTGVDHGGWESHDP